MSTQIKSDAGSRGYTGIFARIVLLVTFTLTLAGCGGGGGASGAAGCPLNQAQIDAITDIANVPAECLSKLPNPDDTLLGRMFVLGTQVDLAGNLRIFVNGTDSLGNPLALADFETATVTVGGVDHDADPPVIPPAVPTSLVTVEPVENGDEVLSLGFITDYSLSISDSELMAISNVFSYILTSLSPPILPQIFEGIAINFGATVVVQQDWTDNALGELNDAFDLDLGLFNDNDFRNGTAIFDALGRSLERVETDPAEDGLIERCRPAHLQIAFTDGKDNASTTYTKGQLLPVIENSSAVMIMLGSLGADKAALVELAGDQGAFAYAYNLAAIETVVQAWADSLSDMVKFTLDPATLFANATISIELTTLAGETFTAEVVRPTDGFCELAPPV